MVLYFLAGFATATLILLGVCADPTRMAHAYVGGYGWFVVQRAVLFVLQLLFWPVMVLKAVVSYARRLA